VTLTVPPFPDSPILDAARSVAGRLRAAGHEAWFVGGCVRDHLLGLPIKDIDIATSARPEALERLFPGARGVGANFQVLLVREGDFQFEVATFRHDGAYANHRHPVAVRYGTMLEDAQRRDFTVNALYLDPLDGRIVDHVGGLADLEARRLRCIGDPRIRFNEDALRLMRAVRFAVRLGLEIEPGTWTAIRDLAPTIQYISAERQRDEIERMITGGQPGRAIWMLNEARLLEEVLPEVAALDGVEQSPDYHPEGDAFVHTCLVLDRLEPRSAVTAWAALLHDIGKARTARRDPATGRITFYGHDRIGAEMGRALMRRLRFSEHHVEVIGQIIARHMQYINVPRMRVSTLRRFLAVPYIQEELAVHRADCLGSHGRLESWEFARARLAEWSAAGEGAVLPAPLVAGADLLAMGMQAGPRLGKLLREAFDKQLEGAFATREEALDWAARAWRRDSP
jgi:poly(A) polymerase